MIRRNIRIFVGTLLIVATLHSVRAEDKDAKIALPLDENKLQAQWSDLNDEQSGEVILRNMRGLVRAIHKYHDAHGSIPPAVVPNPDLPIEKRLSGFVLLLPFLDVTDFARGEKPGPRFFDRQLSSKAKKLSELIDLKKAWDDPVNLKYARTVVPAFLAPDSGSFRDKNGYAVSHFAFVRGANGKNDGAFNETVGITFGRSKVMIADGTVNTLALGQINDDLGPWIAAGFSTSRHVYHPSDVFMDPTFGSHYDGGCYFVNCDSYAYFLHIDKTSAKSFHAMATRDGGELIRFSELPLYRSVVEWVLAR